MIQTSAAKQKSSWGKHNYRKCSLKCKKRRFYLFWAVTLKEMWLSVGTPSHQPRIQCLESCLESLQGWRWRCRLQFGNASRRYRTCCDIVFCVWSIVWNVFPTELLEWRVVSFFCFVFSKSSPRSSQWGNIITGNFISTGCRLLIQTSCCRIF